MYSWHGCVWWTVPHFTTTLTLCPCKPNTVPSVGHWSNYVYFHTHLVKMKVISIKKVCYGATDFCHLKETIMCESGWLWGAFFLECSKHSLISTQQNLIFIQCRLSLGKVTLALLASLLLSGFVFVVVVNSQQIVKNNSFINFIHQVVILSVLLQFN